ncbi:hypothetical protein [Streptomyces profundus]|uniref:hypothetical protein n=1 Tax=Streptomyces profundus TaxID=2867410 RepID=UPI001D16435C|nr:hypothetical protein [Streptomyces sp. MA3_2.13]UED85712.1 hypothetical protein K4G22_17170 [Streptomyces sp. MA3_2.13]
MLGWTREGEWGMGERRVRFGVPWWVASGWGVATAVAWTTSVAAFREQLSTLGMAFALLGGLAGWRLLESRATSVTLTPHAVHERRLAGEERVSPWSVVEAVVVAGGAVELTRRAGGRRRLPVPRRLFGPRRFARELTRLRAAVAEHAEDIPVGETDGAPWWRRWAPRSAVVLAALALVALGLHRDAPWHAPWWPGSETVAALPGACDVVERHGGELLPDDPSLLSEPGFHSFPGDLGYCSAGGHMEHLELILLRYPWDGPDEESPTDRARDQYEGDSLPGARSERVGGQPWLVAERHGDVFHSVTLRHQRGNVVVEIELVLRDLDGVRIEPDRRAELERFAERVVTEVHG